MSDYEKLVVDYLTYLFKAKAFLVEGCTCLQRYRVKLVKGHIDVQVNRVNMLGIYYPDSGSDHFLEFIFDSVARTANYANPYKKSMELLHGDRTVAVLPYEEFKAGEYE